MRIVSFLFGLLLATHVWALSEPVSNTPFASTARYAGSSASLRAVGLRKKFVFKVYAFGLYANAKANRANLFSAQSGLGLEMKLLRTVDGKDITAAINESVKPRLAKSDYPQLPKLSGFFKGKVNKGDSIKFFWNAQGLAVLKNNRRLGTIASQGFAQAFFKIYLGSKPLVAAAKQQFMTSLQ